MVNAKKKTIIYILVFCIILISVIGIAVYVMGSSGRELRECLDLGHKFLVEQDYEQAISSFKKAIGIDPQNEDARIGIADAYIGLADDELSTLDADILSKPYLDNYADTYAKALSYYDEAINALTAGLETDPSDNVNEKIKEIQKRIDDVNKALEIARLNENAAKEAEKQAEIEQKLSEFDYADLSSIYELIRNSETYYLTADEASISYGALSYFLYEYISLLYENRDATYLKKYFPTQELDAVKKGEMPWFQMGASNDADYTSFWEACEDIILCYRAQHKLDEIAEIKSMMEEVLGGDYFSDIYSYYYDDGSGVALYTLDKYDQIIEIAYPNGDWCKWEYDQYGNKTMYTSSLGTWKNLIYDDNQRVYEFHMGDSSGTNQITTYEYFGFDDDFSEEAMTQTYYDGNMNYQFELTVYIDVLGNNVYTDYSSLY